MRATLSYDDSLPDTMEVEMQGIRLGEWVILTTPGELYTEIGLAMKALAPDQKILVSELTNGHVGYISPDTTLGSTAYGGRYYSGRLGYGSKDQMVKAAEAILQKIAI